MARKILKNKPLVEALFEIRWELQESEAGGKTDPNYKFLIGRLYDQLIKEYPFHEQLPSASMPEEMCEHIIQHRFRKGENKWPLVQIGPGILSINSTKDYDWDDFKKRIVNAINIFYKSYPESENIIITSLMLRYIDAIKFDYTNGDIIDFISEKMNISVSIPEQLFNEGHVEQKPLSFNWSFSYPCTKPKSIINLRLGRSKSVENNNGLMWETIVSSQSDIPKLPSELKKWLKDAHYLTDDWFFKLVEGDLLKEFE